MYRLRLQAVDSRLATPEELAAAGIEKGQIPSDKDGHPLQIGAHQAATVKALRYGDAPIVINRAMTGDGKTMAGRFQLLSEKWRSFAMYPTNELAHDQVQSFNELMAGWTPPAWGSIPNTELISAARIDDLEGLQDFSRFERLEMLLQSDYIMTNPDIFHLIMNFGYTQYGTARDLLPTTLATWHRLFIFDEFHLFGVEQVCSVMIALLLLQQLKSENKPSRFLFLSATPQDMLLALAKRLGISYEYIDGQYEHGHLKAPFTHRRILQPSDIHIYTGDLESWIATHYEDVIFAFFTTHQTNAKGLIIANSIAAAHRIYEFLKPIGEKYNINIELNTSFVPSKERRYDFDLLVATSTVDVGVDFKINFLVFESLDSSSHIQRLGRLGRHTHDKNGNKFDVFEAHALLPKWIIEGLQTKFADGSEISREEYKAVVDEFYFSRKQFEHYVEKWAWVQAVRVLQALNKWDVKEQSQIINQNLEEKYTMLFSRRVTKAKKIFKPRSEATWAAASSFRASTNFTALMLNPKNELQPVTSTNIVTLLRNCEIEALTLEETYRYAERYGQKRYPLERTNPLMAYKLHGWLKKPREILLHLDADIEREGILEEQVIEQNRFIFEVIGIPELQKLNAKLEQRILVAFLYFHTSPQEVRRMKRLPYQIELFQFRARSIIGTVAFGRDALLLDTLPRQKSKSAIIL